MINKLLKFIYFLIPCICVLIGLEIILRFTNLSPYQVPVYPYDYFEKNDIYGYDIKREKNFLQMNTVLLFGVMKLGVLTTRLII